MTRLLVVIGALFASITPAASASVVFFGNWETGDVSQWYSSQCVGSEDIAGLEGRRGTVNVVRQPVAQGKYAALFTLPPSQGASMTACEVLHRRTEALGTDDWYALEVYFPPHWREPSRWGLLFGQLSFPNLGVGPPIGLDARRDHVNLVLQAGSCDASTDRCQFTTGNDWRGESGTLNTTLRLLPKRTRLTRTWQQFVVHVHWAADSSGLVQGWWRPRSAGSTWKQTVELRGVSTVQWSPAHPAEASGKTYDKIGAYRGPAAFPISIVQDGFCIATSFSDAASCLQ